ncbi:hypothetical protein BDV37DRAFT_240816 [Aspergillus pseudonomiae]|uniref:Uncharacterized protein n=1 Tax=Aspergillus pseudonomiae TaxID=1506151 RepID=A0A5N7DML1_9EURO|nr:uncharacterized protein BDV37DRAFT_240816 [Aspergillus pseudonomiae]KAE8407691.1 hypothetical protein BDV37DRAFT_240816 [Aspergillus pseudonomiae]
MRTQNYFSASRVCQPVASLLLIVLLFIILATSLFATRAVVRRNTKRSKATKRRTELMHVTCRVNETRIQFASLHPGFRSNYAPS